jgi:hypothetical protein
MKDWLKDALSSQQEEEDKKVAEARNRAEKIATLKTTAVEYINHSGIYDVIAKYFTDIKDRNAVAKVEVDKTVRSIPYDINGYYYDNIQGLEYISTKDNSYHDSDSGWIANYIGAGNEIHSKITTTGGTEICHVTIAVLLKRNREYVFSPVIVIAFGDALGHKDEDTFSIIDPDKRKLFAWFKEKTALYLKKISS